MSDTQKLPLKMLDHGIEAYKKSPYPTGVSVYLADHRMAWQVFCKLFEIN